MSQFINVFCRSTGILESDELVAFIQDSWYGDGDVAFRRQPDDGDADWQLVEFTLPDSDRPIQIERDTAPEKVGELVAETLGELGADAPNSVIEHLNEAKQAIGVELYPERFTPDAWELLDLILALLASRLDGLIVDDEAVYDGELRRLLERGH